MATPRLNWDVLIRCVDCDATYQVLEPDPSKERLEDGQRLVLIDIPNECPECRNLRLRLVK